jgi:hypothetical protein
MRMTSLALLLALVACVDRDEPPDDSGVGRDASIDAGWREGGTTLDAGSFDARLPPRDARIRCYFGPTYNCRAPGSACCDASGVCYVPDEEPDFCR